MDQDQLVEGANRMLRVAKEVLASQTARQVNQLLLQDTDVTEQQEDAASVRSVRFDTGPIFYGAGSIHCVAGSVKNLLPSIEPAPIHRSLSCRSGHAHRSTGRRPCY